MSTYGCTAPKGGHILASAASRCPVHGKPGAMPTLPAIPTLPPRPLNVDELIGVAAADADDPDHELLLALASSPDPMTRLLAAGSPLAAPEVLEEMASAGDVDVVIAQIAANPRTPPAVLARMATTLDGSGIGAVTRRRNAAANPSTPREALLEVIRSERTWEDAASAAAANPALELDDVARLVHEAYRSQAVHMAVMGRDDLTEEFLARAATGTTSEVRAKVAGHPRASSTTLARLARDPDSDVLAAVAANRNTPDTLLSGLVAGGHVTRDVTITTKVRAAAASNRSTPVDGLREALARETRPGHPPDWAVVERILHNPTLPGREIQDVIDTPQSPVYRAYAEAARTTHIAHATGINARNVEAISVLADTAAAWWELDENSPEVSLVRAMHPDA